MGAPIKDVITPTGRIIGDIMVRDRVSEISNNSAPKRAVAGSKNLKSFPMSLLTIWGATRPINPITPIRDTTTLVIKDEISIPSILNL